MTAMSKRATEAIIVRGACQNNLKTSISSCRTAS